VLHVSCAVIARGLCHWEADDTTLYRELWACLHVLAQVSLWVEPYWVAVGLHQILWVLLLFSFIFISC
jgi:hypothetical protein